MAPSRANSSRATASEGLVLIPAINKNCTTGYKNVTYDRKQRGLKKFKAHLLFSSRLVLSQAHTRATCARVAAFAPRRTIRTGSQSAQRRHAAAKRTTLTSWRCCGFGTS